MKLKREPIQRVEIKIIEFDGKEYVGSKGFFVYAIQQRKWRR
jgi:hypothetical protein